MGWQSDWNRIDPWMKHNTVIIIILGICFVIIFSLHSMTVDNYEEPSDSPLSSISVLLMLSLMAIVGMRYWGKLLPSEIEIEKQCADAMEKFWSGDREWSNSNILRYSLCEEEHFHWSGLLKAVSTGSPPSW